MYKQPQRTCMGCNNKNDKINLLRVVKNKKDEVSIDTTGKLEGRGAYLCKTISCLDKVIKSKRIERMLEIKIPSEVYEEIRSIILKNEI